MQILKIYIPGPKCLKVNGAAGPVAFRSQEAGGDLGPVGIKTTLLTEQEKAAPTLPLPTRPHQGSVPASSHQLASFSNSILRTLNFCLTLKHSPDSEKTLRGHRSSTPPSLSYLKPELRLFCSRGAEQDPGRLLLSFLYFLGSQRT